MAKIERAIITGKTDGKGLFVQPKLYDAKDEVVEAHIRETFVSVFHYADEGTSNPRQYDPTGNYACEDCNKFDGPSECLLVEGDDIEPKHGSCEHWENQFAGDSELLMGQKISKGAANYAVTSAAGFGCKRCEYSEPATKPDSVGRDTFCRRGRLRVDGNACCALNDSDKLTEFDENEPESEDDEKEDADDGQDEKEAE